MRTVSCCLLVVVACARVLAAAESIEVPPLPPLPERWSVDPLRGQLIQELALDVRALPEIELDGHRVRVVLRQNDMVWRAQLERARVPSQHVPVQALFRRLVIGPVGPQHLGLPVSEDGTAAYHWLLIKDGRVVIDTHLGRPRYIDDEFDFDIAFHDVRATDWTPEQRVAWRTAFWEQERTLLRQHLGVDDDDDDGPEDEDDVIDDEDHDDGFDPEQ